MFKKFSSAVLGAVIAITATAVGAAPVAEVTDVLTNSLRVSGDAKAGSYVSIMITNPGYTYEQAISGSDGAVQYFGGKRSKSDTYSFDIPISGSVGGDFGVYVDIDGKEESSQFTFYTTPFKKECIQTLNAAKNSTTIVPILDNIMAIFSFADDDLYTKGDKTEIAQSILDVRKLQDGGVYSENVEDMEQIVACIKKALILASFNASATNIVTDNGGIIKYAEEIGLNLSEDEYDDYLKNLSDDGKLKVVDGMLGCGFESEKDAQDKFVDLVHINVLLNYREKGYGHIQNYFSKYKNVYEEAGFKIPSSENRTLYLDFLDLSYDDDLKSLASKFNKLVDDQGSSSGGSGDKKPSSSGGIGKAPSSGGASGGAVSYLPPNVESVQPGTTDGNSEQTNPGKISEFMDVADSHWAHESVSALSSKGIINGYPNGDFRPSDNITRAEFAQIVKRAFSISGEASEFTDVPKDAWYYEAVSALASNGYISGFDGKYNPDDDITREDAALIIFRCLGIGASGTVSFIDSDSFSSYSKDAVATLASLGILNGYEDGTFKPNGEITRAEAAKIIYSCIAKEAV